MKSRNLLYPLFVVPFVLTGCWDQIELEQQAFVVAMGIDQAENHLIDVTFQVANPQVGSTMQAEAQSEPASDIVTFTVPSLLGAKEIANTVLTRQLSFAHLETIIVSEEVARSESFDHIIESSVRDPEIMRETTLIISREKASEFIHANKPKLETRPHKYYMFMKQRWRETGLVPASTLDRYLQHRPGQLFLAVYASAKTYHSEAKRKETDYLPGDIPQQSGDPVQMIGSAVFKDSRMVDTFSGLETRLVLYLRKKTEAYQFIGSVIDPLDKNYSIAVRIIKTSTDVQTNLNVYPPAIHIRPTLKVQVLTVPSLIEYSQSPSKQALLKASIKEELESRSKQLIEKTQKEMGADPFHWELEARKKFWTMSAFEDFEWERQYPLANIEVDYNIELVNFGKQTTQK